MMCDHAYLRSFLGLPDSPFWKKKKKKHFTFTIALSPASGINENRLSVKETCSILAPFCSGLAYHMGGMAINFRGVAKGGGVRCPWILL